MSFHADTVLAIAGMALATYLTRVLGLFLMRFVRIEGRTRAALDALPPAILMAVIAPAIFLSGAAEAGAAAIAAAAAILRLPLLAVVVIGVAAVVALRHVLPS